MSGKPEEKKRIRMVCSHCGSDKLWFDAYAVWNEETQQFELKTVFPKPTMCEQCAGETSVKEEEIA